MESIVEKCDGWSHAGKLCKCWECGTVARCTPGFDYYADDDGDPLQCENCFRTTLEKRGLKLGDGFDPVVDPRN